MKTILVIPSCRMDSVKEFLKAWDNTGGWDAILLIEDSPNRTEVVDVDFHYSWKDIENVLGKDSWIISRKDSAIRSFGFLEAVRLGADVVVTLDDDCFPAKSPYKVNWTADHVGNLVASSKWVSTIPNYRTRGLPYQNLGVLDNVAFSMGLWEGIPDLDACSMLLKSDPPKELPETRIFSCENYFPFCGMNMAFNRKFLPLCYFPLMGQDSPYGRFDDIWFGVICQRILRHLRCVISVGRPYIFHSKKSDPFSNLKKEAPGIAKNETFWETIDQIQLKSDNPCDCVHELGTFLKYSTDDYMAKLGEALIIWSQITGKLL